MKYYKLHKDGRVIDTDTNNVVRDTHKIERIHMRAKALRIPPAYTNVEISQSPNTKVLACGNDNKNRRQCIYNPVYVQQKQHARYEKITKHDRTLRRISKHVRDTVRTKQNNIDYLICMVLHLMLLCNFRIGNERYVKENGSYGLTTLEWKHIRIDGRQVTIRFLGKKGVENMAVCKDPSVFAFVKHTMSKQKPHDRVFPGVTSHQVNEWLKAFDMNAKITSKDLRTWQANRLFKKYMKETKDTKLAIQRVAADLHNTASVCRKNYIDPRLVPA